MPGGISGCLPEPNQSGTFWLVKTTLEIPDELYERAKMQAEHENLEINDLVSQGLRLVLRIESKPSTGHPRRITGPLVMISPGNVIPALSNDEMATLLESTGERLP
jgi:hypothetical protein